MHLIIYTKNSSSSSSKLNWNKERQTILCLLYMKRCLVRTICFISYFVHCCKVKTNSTAASTKHCSGIFNYGCKQSYCIIC